MLTTSIVGVLYSIKRTTRFINSYLCGESNMYIFDSRKWNYVTRTCRSFIQEGSIKMRITIFTIENYDAVYIQGTRHFFFAWLAFYACL